MMTRLVDCREVESSEIDELIREFKDCDERCTVLKHLYSISVDEWKKNVLADEHILYYAMYDGSDLIGVGRITPYPVNVDTGSLGYCIRPSKRRKGYGTMLAKMIVERCDQLGVVPWACIRYDNVKSMKTAEAAGLKKSGILYRWRDGSIAVEYCKR